MSDLWTLLEERTRAWDTLERQGVADLIWEACVSIRFGRTGDARALQYLQPYLNHASRHTRFRALDVACSVVEGCGSDRALDVLSYFARNPDPFLRDRAVQLVGAAMTGAHPKAIVDALAPYLEHPSQFIRKNALVALGRASAGQASPQVWSEIQRVAGRPGPRPDEAAMAVARAFSGHPDEQSYGYVRQVFSADQDPWDLCEPMAILVRGADREWLERAFADVFGPCIDWNGPGWRGPMLRRAGGIGWCHASSGLGAWALERVLPICAERCPGHALMSDAQGLFVGADLAANRQLLLDLVSGGDIPVQRLAAVCLGRLAMGASDEAAIGALHGLTSARNGAVRAAALAGLGMAARSTCDETVMHTCLSLADDAETAGAAIGALGMVFLGSAHEGAFSALRALADEYVHRPAPGRRSSRPLTAIYWATGLVFLGTGSSEPLDWLLGALAGRHRWPASAALVMVEHPETALRRAWRDLPLWSPSGLPYP